jgi:hypothetical protein
MELKNEQCNARAWNVNEKWNVGPCTLNGPGFPFLF